MRRVVRVIFLFLALLTAFGVGMFAQYARSHHILWLLQTGESPIDANCHNLTEMRKGLHVFYATNDRWPGTTKELMHSGVVRDKLVFVPPIQGTKGGGYALYPSGTSHGPEPCIYQHSPYTYMGQLHSINLPSGLCVFVRPDDLMRVLESSQMASVSTPEETKEPRPNRKE